MSDVKVEKEWAVAGQPLSDAVPDATTKAMEAVHDFGEEVIGVYILVVGHRTHTVEACVMIGDVPNDNLKNIIYRRVLEGIGTKFPGTPAGAKAGH